MIALDTNVIVRYLAQDDRSQSQKATTLIEALTEENKGYICLVSIVELVWVMQGCYASSKDEIVLILKKLLQIRTILVENAEVVLKALHTYSGSAGDFADCLIEGSARDAGCTATMTFDTKAAKTAGMRLIES